MVTLAQAMGGKGLQIRLFLWFKDAHPTIAEQAKEFKAYIHKAVQYFIWEAIKEDRSKVITLLRSAGHNDPWLTQWRNYNGIFRKFYVYFFKKKELMEAVHNFSLKIQVVIPLGWLCIQIHRHLLLPLQRTLPVLMISGTIQLPKGNTTRG